MESEFNICERFKESIRKAMDKSCEEAFEFSYDETHLIDAEYLLTVNVAKAINDLNECYGTPYKICLENKTKEFSTSCTPALIPRKIGADKKYKKAIFNKKIIQLDLGELI